MVSSNMRRAPILSSGLGFAGKLPLAHLTDDAKCPIEVPGGHRFFEHGIIQEVQEETRAGFRQITFY